VATVQTVVAHSVGLMPGAVNLPLAVGADPLAGARIALAETALAAIIDASVEGQRRVAYVLESAAREIRGE
jgi:hypothetical protein